MSRDDEYTVNSVDQRPLRQRRVPILGIASIMVLVVLLLPLLLLQPPSNTLTIPRQNTTFAAPATGSVGSLAFTSSNQLNPISSTGLNDIVTLRLTNVSLPRKGKSDFAWLEADKGRDSITPILLGKLSLVKGSVLLSYQDPGHRDLLATYSQLLITEQDDIEPSLPSLDAKTWRFQAAIDNTPTPGDERGYSLLAHLRHLLADDPTLDELGLQGGLGIWLYRNAGKVLEWSSAAQGDWTANDVRDLRNNITRIVDYLDGQSYAFRDLPAGTPWLADPADGPFAGRPGLIDYTTPQVEVGPASYVSHIRVHLAGMHAPGHTAEQLQLVSTIDTALTQIDAVLKQIRTDARKLASMNNAQLTGQGALALLNDLLTTVDRAVNTTDPVTGASIHGVAWVHAQLQLLATVPVVAVIGNGP